MLWDTSPMIHFGVFVTVTEEGVCLLLGQPSPLLHWVLLLLGPSLHCVSKREQKLEAA